MEVKGKVSKVLPVQEGQGKNGNPWKKAGLVLETEGQYPKFICLTTWGALVDQSLGLTIGSTVVAQIDIESREFQERWYTDVKAWKIDLAQEGSIEGAGQAPSNGFNANSAPQQQSAPSSIVDNDTDDLPF